MKMKYYHLIYAVIMFTATNLLANTGNWIATNGPYGTSVSKIRHASIGGTIYLATLTDGIYKSNNNGISWYSMNDNILKYNSRVNDIFVDTDGTVFAATDSLGILFKYISDPWVKMNTGFGGHLSFKSIIKIAENTYIAGSNGKAIFKTSDKGKTWYNYNDGLQSTETINTIIKVNNKIIIGTNRGIFKSIDEGQKWQILNDKIGSVNELIINIDNNFLYAGTSLGLFISSDNGENWIKKDNSNIPSINIQALTFVGNTLYLGTSFNGLFSTDINDMNIVEIDINLPSKNITALANLDGKLFIGNHFSLMEKTINGFEYRLYGIGVRSINFFLNIADEVYAATDMGIYKTTNDGITWLQKNSGIGNITLVNCLLFSKSGRLFSGTFGDGLYFSDDFGETWIKNPDKGLSTVKINQLLEDENGKIYLGSEDQGIFISLDGGDNWFKMNGEELNSSSILTFKILNDGSILAGTASDGLFMKNEFEDWKQLQSIGTGIKKVFAIETLNGENESTIIASTNYGIYRSYVNGKTWIKAVGELEGPLKNLYLSSDSILYGSINQVTGIFTSKDLGDNWTQVSEDGEVNNKTITAFIESKKGYIYAGTQSGNCYRTLNGKQTIPKKDPKIQVLGQTSFCEGNFSILDGGDGWFEYQWSDGKKSRFDTVWTEGTYWFNALDSLSLKVKSDSITIEVYPKPEKPQIYYNGDILLCNIDAANYRWYFHDELIQGINSKTFKPEVEGWYRCEVLSLFNCSNFSDEYFVEFPISIILEDNDFIRDINLFGDFLLFESERNEFICLKLYDSYGQLLINSVNYGLDKIDLSEFPNGVYFLQINDKKKSEIRKFLFYR